MTEDTSSEAVGADPEALVPTAESSSFSLAAADVVVDFNGVDAVVAAAEVVVTAIIVVVVVALDAAVDAVVDAAVDAVVKAVFAAVVAAIAGSRDSSASMVIDMLASLTGTGEVWSSSSRRTSFSFCSSDGGAGL